MAVFRVNKNKDYATMSKFHFREKNMSLKAIGMLSLMLSLPDDWDYSVEGLTSMRCETKNTINSILNELEAFGYLKRTKVRSKTGTYTNCVYDIYEKPYTNNQDMENRDMENPYMENCTQLNNKELNNKELNNKKYIYRFQKPTIDEIKAYCKERNNNVDPNKFFDFYEAKDWMIGKNKMKDWKACVRTWEKPSAKKDIKRPEWFDKEYKKEEFVITDEIKRKYGLMD